MIHRLISCGQANTEVARAEFDIARCAEGVGFAHCLRLRWCERSLEKLHSLEEDNDLICGQAFDVFWAGSEVLQSHLV